MPTRHTHNSICESISFAQWLWSILKSKLNISIILLQRCVFPQYPDLGNRFFLRMHKTAKAKTKYLGVTAFRQQCELYLSVLDDALIHEHYVKMFILNGSNAGTSSGGGSDSSKEKISEDDVLLMNMDGLSDLLLTSFRIAIANYVISSGSTSDYNSCLPTETYCPYVREPFVHRNAHQSASLLLIFVCISFSDKSYHFVGDAFVFLRQRYVKRWFRVPLAGEEYSESDSATASFLRAHIDNGVS